LGGTWALYRARGKKVQENAEAKQVFSNGLGRLAFHFFSNPKRPQLGLAFSIERGEQGDQKNNGENKPHDTDQNNPPDFAADIGCDYK
jgi:hypothetical protein